MRKSLYAIHRLLCALIAAQAKRKDILDVLNQLLQEIHRIVFLNFKGGTGKTTLSACFTDYLADFVASLEYQQETLAIFLQAIQQENMVSHEESEEAENEEAVWAFDLDMQSNYTANFLRPLPEQSLVDVLYEKAKLKEVAVRIRENFWVFPGGLKMSEAAAYVRSQDGGVKRLFQEIINLLVEGGLPNSQDKKVLPRYIIFDTASDNGATTSAFLAANELIAPIEYKFFSMVGIFSMIKTLGQRMELLDHELDIRAIIPNQVNDRRRKTLEYYRSLRGDPDLRDIIYPALHVDGLFDEAQENLKTIFSYPRARGSKGRKEMTRIMQLYTGMSSMEDYLRELEQEAQLEERTDKQSTSVSSTVSSPGKE